MDLQKDKYIIIEIIPTHSNPEKGFIAQISALKLDGIKLLDRFDYRVKDNLIKNQDVKEMIQYEKNNFTYVDNEYFIPEKLKHWVEDYPLLLLEDNYTKDYLSELSNEKELVYKYLKMDYSIDIFPRIMEKYQLAPSNHLVDLIYEAIIKEGNNN